MKCQPQWVCACFVVASVALGAGIPPKPTEKDVTAAVRRNLESGTGMGPGSGFFGAYGFATAMWNNVKLEELSVVKYGSPNQEKGYWPVELCARVSYSGMGSPFNVASARMRYRFSRNDFGEWEGTEVKPPSGESGEKLRCEAGPAVPERKERLSPQEAAVLDDLRMIDAAELSYMSSEGFFAPLQCLRTPLSCNPRSKNTSAYIGDDLASMAPKDDYRRQFYPGPGQGVNRLRGYAYTAVPIQPSAATRRAFCSFFSGATISDATGGICFTADGKEPPVENGRCKPCNLLQ